MLLNPTVKTQCSLFERALTIRRTVKQDDHTIFSSQNYILSARKISSGPLSTHVLGAVRSRFFSFANRKSFSGTNTQCDGSGGGTDVTALSSSSAIIISSGLSVTPSLRTNDIVRKVIEILRLSLVSGCRQALHNIQDHSCHNQTDLKLIVTNQSPGKTQLLTFNFLSSDEEPIIKEALDCNQDMTANK